MDIVGVIVLIWSFIFFIVCPFAWLLYKIFYSIGFRGLNAVIAVKKNKKTKILVHCFSDNKQTQYKVANIISTSVINLDLKGKEPSSYTYSAADVYYKYGVPCLDVFDSDFEARSPILKINSPLSPKLVFQITDQVIHIKSKANSLKDALMHPVIIGIFIMLFLIICGLIAAIVLNGSSFSESITTLTAGKVVSNIVSN